MVCYCVRATYPLIRMNWFSKAAVSPLAITFLRGSFLPLPDPVSITVRCCLFGGASGRSQSLPSSDYDKDTSRGSIRPLDTEYGIHLWPTDHTSFGKKRVFHLPLVACDRVPVPVSVRGGSIENRCSPRDTVGGRSALSSLHQSIVVTSLVWSRQIQN